MSPVPWAGSAADLCKMAMVVSTERLLRRAQARLLLQIHDELVWEVLDQHLHLAAGYINNYRYILFRF